MAVNKVELSNGEVLIDLTSDTATEEAVLEGAVFHGADGSTKTGAFTIAQELSEQDSLIEQIKTALRGKVADSGAPGIDSIPAGWARADYIQFSGEQIVDTGIICNQNTRIQLAFTREKSSQHYLYGVASSNNTASVTAYLGGSWRFGNKSTTKTPTTHENMIYSGFVDKANVIITGSASAINDVSDFKTIGTLLVGSCRNSDGTVGTAQFEGKIFFF
jgi:hypothetical protein